MEPRTGKTKVAVDFASIRHQQDEVSRVLVVCPVSVMGVWADEIEANCPFPHRTLIWDKVARKTEPLPKFGSPVLDFVIVNYDAFSVPGKIVGRDKTGAIVRSKRGGRFELKKGLIDWQPQLMILDESHRIKSPSARKTTTIRSVAHVMGIGNVVKAARVPYRIIMTGTAVTKKQRVIDIYSQWSYFLNPTGWVSEYTSGTFKSEFGVWRSFDKYDRFVRPRNLPKLKRHLHDDSFAVTREECFDLPPQRTQIIPVYLDPETQRIYVEMAEELIAQIKTGEVTVAQIKLVARLRLCQITSGFTKTEPSNAYPQGRLVRIGKEKLDVLEDRLSDLWEADQKVVVAARFRADIAATVALAARHKVKAFELHGGVERRRRDQAIQGFRALDGPGVFVMQPQAGSLGIDLRTAATMIWVSLTDSFVDWSQSIDRIALSPRGTVIEYLLAKGTVDELMHESLLGDKDLVKEIQRSPDSLLRSFR